MNEERKQILNMLDEGKIDVEEAEELLSALGEPQEESAGFDTEVSSGEEARALKIVVTESGKKKVNISIPIKLVKMLKGFLPKKAKKKLDEKGIDVEKIMDEIDQRTPDGKLVDIEDGENHVEIKLVK